MTTPTKQPTRRRFSVKDYYRMAAAGILSEDDRVELIDGEVIEMPPIGDWHQESVDRWTELLVHRFSDVARVRVQGPVRLDTYNEPQPDLLLLHRRPGFYAAGHPGPVDVFLAVEISDTTARYDRQVKAPLYARQGVPETWVMERQQETVTVYRDPGPDGYRSVQTLRRDDRITPLAFPDREIAVSDLAPQ